MGVKCSCKANQPGPDLLLGTENERRTVKQDLYAPVHFNDPGTTIGDGQDEGFGLITVEDLASGHLKHQRIGLDGITTRPRMASGVLDAFKTLFIKESKWVGKLKFSLEEGLSDEFILEYKVTGFTKKGDIKGERIVRKLLPTPEDASPMYEVTTFPCKIIFDTFFPTGEGPVFLFKCEDSEIVLLVDTRIQLVNNTFDVTGRYVEGIGYRKKPRRNSESKSFDPDDSSTSDSETKVRQSAVSEASFDGHHRRTVSTEANSVLRNILVSRHRASRTVQVQEHKSGFSDFEDLSDEEKAHEIDPPSRRASGAGRRRPQSQETPYQGSGEFYLQRVVAGPRAEEDPLSSLPSDFLRGALERMSSAYLASPYKKSCPLVQQKQEPFPVFEMKEEEKSEEVYSDSDDPPSRGRPRSIAVVDSSPQQQQLSPSDHEDPGRRSMASISLIKEDDDFQPGSALFKPDIKLRLLCGFDPPPMDEQKPPDPSEEKRAAFDSYIMDSRGGPGYAKLYDRRISI